MADIRDHVLFGLLGLLGAFAFALVGLNRREHVNALWIMITAIAVYLISYRYYSRSSPGT